LSKYISIIKKKSDKIESKTQKWKLNWNNEIYTRTKLKSGQWYLIDMVISYHVTLTLPGVTIGTWHVRTKNFCKKD